MVVVVAVVVDGRILVVEGEKRWSMTSWLVRKGTPRKSLNVYSVIASLDILKYDT